MLIYLFCRFFYLARSPSCSEDLDAFNAGLGEKILIMTPHGWTKLYPQCNSRDAARIELSIFTGFCDNIHSISFSMVKMKNYKRSIIFALFAGLIFTGLAHAQDNSFSNADVDYVFDLPDQRWKLTVKPSATTPNVEFVYGDRTDGHLEVRRLGLSSKAVISDVIKDEEQRLQFLPGYVAGKEEQFGGFLNGMVFNFEFVRAGRPMSGRFYFLKANESTVYVLRFTGFRDKLRTIRNQTDSIARSFNIKRR